jgi:VIT1/CCC1 family predicted Fe2+/Mn2+ transporter
MPHNAIIDPEAVLMLWLETIRTQDAKPKVKVHGMKKTIHMFVATKDQLDVLQTGGSSTQDSVVTSSLSLFVPCVMNAVIFYFSPGTLGVAFWVNAAVALAALSVTGVVRAISKKEKNLVDRIYEEITLSQRLEMKENSLTAEFIDPRRD